MRSFIIFIGALILSDTLVAFCGANENANHSLGAKRSREKILADATAAWEELEELSLVNLKVECESTTVKVYKPDEASKLNLEGNTITTRRTSRCELRLDKSLGLIEITEIGGKFDGGGRVVGFNGDYWFDIYRNEPDISFQLDGHRKSEETGGDQKRTALQYLQLQLQNLQAGYRISNVSTIRELFESGRTKIESVSAVERDGRTHYEVKCREEWPSGVVNTYVFVLDPDLHYCAVYINDTHKEQKFATRTVREIEYQRTPDGLPFPKKVVERSYLLEDEGTDYGAVTTRTYSVPEQSELTKEQVMLSAYGLPEISPEKRYLRIIGIGVFLLALLLLFRIAYRKISEQR